MVKQKRRGFNWSGITDNGDGTYTTKGRIEKRRLLKSLHASGYSVRSTQNADGTWRVVPVGTLRQVRRGRSSVRSGYGYRTRTRFVTQRQGRYAPLARRNLQYRRGAIPRPIMMHPGGVHSQARPVFSVHPKQLFNEGGHPKAPGILQRMTERNRARQGQGPESKRAIVAESLKIEAEMAERSKGQPSTRIITRTEQGRILARHGEQRGIRVQARSEQSQARSEQIQGRHATEREKRVQLRQQAIESGQHQERPFHQPQKITTHYHAPPSSQKIRTNYEPKIDQSALQREREKELTG